jgi:hypothetical protein
MCRILIDRLLDRTGFLSNFSYIIVERREAAVARTPGRSGSGREIRGRDGSGRPHFLTEGTRARKEVGIDTHTYYSRAQRTLYIY